jgi:hypothetical protein
VRVGVHQLLLMTRLCNKSAIRLCAVDLPEMAKGAVKSNSGSRVHQECYSNKKLPSREIFVFKQ